MAGKMKQSRKISARTAMLITAIWFFFRRSQASDHSDWPLMTSFAAFFSVGMILKIWMVDD
jgi:hypothetical protein